MIMILVFVSGILIFLAFAWITIEMFKDDNSFSENMKYNWNESKFLTIVYVLMGIISVIMIYSGFTVPSSDISHVTDNHDGTLTSVEYSISGDSVTIKNIKAPKDIYGIIEEIHTEHHLVGKVNKTYTIITSKLNDGREVVDKIDYIHETPKVGNGMRVHETFYPCHTIEYFY